MSRLLLLPLLILVAVLPFVESLVAQQPARPPRKVALLVGPKEYLHDFNTLPHLDDDVTALAAELRKGGFDEVVVLTDKPEGKHPATKKHILAELDRLLTGGGDAAKAVRKDDVVLLALSGHGQEAFADGKTKDTFFAPTDGKKRQATTLVNVGEVLDRIGGCGCRTLVLADMCRDVYDPNKGKGVDTDNLRLPKNAAILFGCESTQQSFVNTDLKHSLFTYAVLEVLRESHAAGRPLLWSQLVSGVELKFGSEQYQKLMGAERQQSPVERKTDLKATALMAAVAPPKEPKPGEEREFAVADGVKMTFCWIPPGEAQLGSPKAEREAVMKQLGDKEEPEWLKSEAEGVRGKHVERKGFWLAKYPATQEEWTAVMGEKKEWIYFRKDGGGADSVKGLDTSRFPAEQVNWDDCQEFLGKVNKRSGIGAAFGAGAKLVLPHEDRWEYAYRGNLGNKRAFYWGDALNGDVANCDGNDQYGTTEKGKYLARPSVVGSYESKAKHPWGLCDMSGNMWQWCENKYSSDSTSRVLRGGSWSSSARYCRAAFRNYIFAPANRFYFVGFRVCAVLD